MSVGKTIKELRKEKDLTQKELAYAVGITNVYLSMIENSIKTPSLKLLAKLSEVFGVPLQLLLAEFSWK